MNSLPDKEGMAWQYNRAEKNGMMTNGKRNENFFILSWVQVGKPEDNGEEIQGEKKEKVEKKEKFLVGFPKKKWTKGVWHWCQAREKGWSELLEKRKSP